MTTGKQSVSEDNLWSGDKRAAALKPVNVFVYEGRINDFDKNSRVTYFGPRFDIRTGNVSYLPELNYDESTGRVSYPQLLNDISFERIHEICKDNFEYGITPELTGYLVSTDYVCKFDFDNTDPVLRTDMLRRKLRFNSIGKPNHEINDLIMGHLSHPQFEELNRVDLQFSELSNKALQIQFLIDLRDRDFEDVYRVIFLAKLYDLQKDKKNIISNKKLFYYAQKPEIRTFLIYLHNRYKEFPESLFFNISSIIATYPKYKRYFNVFSFNGNVKDLIDNRSDVFYLGPTFRYGEESSDADTELVYYKDGARVAYDDITEILDHNYTLLGAELDRGILISHDFEGHFWLNQFDKSIVQGSNLLDQDIKIDKFLELDEPQIGRAIPQKDHPITLLDEVTQVELSSIFEELTEKDQIPMIEKILSGKSLSDFDIYQLNIKKALNLLRIGSYQQSLDLLEETESNYLSFSKLTKKLVTKEIKNIVYSQSLLNNLNFDFAKLFFFKSGNLIFLLDYLNALHQIQKAISIWERRSQDFEKELLDAYLNTGLMLSTLFRLEEAFEYYEKALIFAEKAEPLRMFPILSNISHIHQQLKRHDLALDVILEALNLKINDGQRAGGLNVLGSIYLNSDIEKAIMSYLEAFEITEKIEMHFSTRRDILFNLIISHVLTGRLELTNKYWKDLQKIYQETNDRTAKQYLDLTTTILQIEKIQSDGPIDNKLSQLYQLIINNKIFTTIRFHALVFLLKYAANWQVEISENWVDDFRNLADRYGTETILNLIEDYKMGEPITDKIEPLIVTQNYLHEIREPLKGWDPSENKNSIK